ncbi:MAG: alpha/beta hydrolase [Gemmatimonadales bacterium]
MSKPLAAALCAVAVASLYLVAAWFLQRPALFPAPQADFPGPTTAAELVRRDGFRALLLLPDARFAGPHPLVIFAHGNGELASYWVGEFGPALSRGVALLLLEYPGYGGAPGSPSETAIRAAALAAFDWGAADSRFDQDRIVAWGRSLGGGAAARIAAERPVAALILESSFTSVRPLAARYLIPGWLVRDPFDNLAALRDYRGPLLVLHGTADRIVPIAEGRALAAAVPGAGLLELPCGHNDCSRPWPGIERFLSANRLLDPP